MRQTLNTFLAQPGRTAVDHELIVVDNNSTDDSRATVQSFRDSLGARYVFEPRQGIACARNCGMAAARGEIVAYLDDDVVVDEHWLTSLRRCLDETGADVVGGRTYLIYQRPPPPWLGREFRTVLAEMEFGDQRKVIPDGRGIFSLNLALRKSALPSDRPFDERLGRRGARRLGGEETKLIRAMAKEGRKVVYEPTMVVGHLVETHRLTWPYFQRMAVADGLQRVVDEPARPFWPQLAMVLERATRCADMMLRLVKATLNDAPGHQRRWEMSLFIQARTMLIERARRLVMRG